MGACQGQFLLPLSSSRSKLTAMSGPVPLALCDVAVPAHRSDISSDYSEVRHNGHCEGSDGAAVLPATVQDVELAEPRRPATGPSQQVFEGTAEVMSETEGSNSDHMPKSVATPEDSSLDLLRIVKHKPSVIVFGDHDNQANSASEGSDTQEFPPSPTEEGVNGDGEDAFPETLQFKELPGISRHHRNRNRKVLRKRQDARPKSFPLDSRDPSSEVKSVFTGSQEQRQPLSNNGKQQVRESVLLLISATKVHFYKIYQSIDCMFYSPSIVISLNT